MNTHPLRLLGAALLCAQCGGLQAAESSPTNDDSVDTVIVTAVPTRGGESHLAQPAIVLAGDELRRKQVATLGETLNRELGMSSTSFGAGASRPLIRGLGGERVRILESGIGAMDASSMSDDHAVSIDPLVARQIEVLKGPATLLYGSGAIGGIVNVVTDRIPSALLAQPRGKFDFSYDEATNAFGGGATVDASHGPIAAHIDGLKRSTSNYDIPGFGDLAPAPGARRGLLGNSDTESDNVTGGMSYVGGRGYLGFSINQYDSTYGIPGDEPRRIALDQDRYDIAGELAAPLPGFTKLRMRMGHNDYMHQELEPDGSVGTTFLNDEYEGRVELSHEAVAGMEGVVGVQVQHRDFSAVGEEQLTPPVESRAVGVFVLEERDIQQLHLQFGARYENVENTPQLPGNPAMSFDVYSVSLGGVWHFMPGYGSGLSFTRGQRAPSIEELYNNGPHDATASFERGDVTIREETANALDWTLHKEDGRLQWELNLFVNYMEDFIYQRSVDGNGDGLADHLDEEGLPVASGAGFVLLESTQADAVFYGAEAEIGYSLLDNSPWGTLDARLYTDYVRGRLTDGDNLPRITPWRFGGGLEYRKQAWHADFDVRRSVAQGANAPLETNTEGYTLVELGMSYTIKSERVEYIVSARGSNLLDEEVRYHTSLLKAVAPQPGRSAMLSLQVNFD